MTFRQKCTVLYTVASPSPAQGRLTVPERRQTLPLPLSDDHPAHLKRLYHRLLLSYRDMQELLHQRGIQISHETLREWCIKFGPLFAEKLRQP